MKKSNKNIKKIIILLIFLSFVFSLNFKYFPETIKNFFFSKSLPVQKVFWQTGKNFSDFFNGISEARLIKQELEKIEIKNQELLSQIISLKELEQENEFLRKSLELGLEKEFKLILVQTASRDVFQDSILINKGKKHGILEGWPVITAQKVLLGRIGQVYDNFSEVILISNKKSSFDAKIFNKEVYGILKGKGNYNIYFELIPKDKEIFEDQIVVSSVLGGIYPAGLFIGKIKIIEKSDLEPFQKAKLSLGFDIKKLNYLFVITEF